MPMPSQNEEAVEFTTANMETAIDFANLARLAAESHDEPEAQRYMAQACQAYEEALDSLEVLTPSDDQWEIIRPLIERFTSLVEARTA